MMQLDLFAEPAPAPSLSTPIVLRFGDKHSYAEVAVAQNSDGSWRVSTADQYAGFCGHGSPMWGEFPAFRDALAKGLERIDRHAAGVLVDRSSCCGDSSRRFAAKVREWVATLEIRHGIQREKAA